MGRAEEAAKPATSARVARGRMRTLAQSVDDYKHTYKVVIDLASTGSPQLPNRS